MTFDHCVFSLLSLSQIHTHRTKVFVINYFLYMLFHSFMCKRYGDWTGHLEYTWALPGETIANLAKRGMELSSSFSSSSSSSSSGKGGGGGDSVDHAHEVFEHFRIEELLFKKNPLFKKERTPIPGIIDYLIDHVCTVVKSRSAQR
jgi:hypothetical protein